MTRSISKPREDSAISSLGELMELERERVAAEERSRLAEHEEKLRADQDAAERLLRLEEERTRKAREMDERRAASERVAEAEARVRAEAEAEKTRLLAVEAAREQSRAKEREHELLLARLSLQEKAARSPVTELVGYGVAVLVLLAGVGGYFAVLAPRADARVAEATRLADERAQELTRAKSSLEVERGRATRLAGELEAARAEVLSLERRVAILQLATTKGQPVSSIAVPLGTSKEPIPPAKPCPKGDPLCVGHMGL